MRRFGMRIAPSFGMRSPTRRFATRHRSPIALLPAARAARARPEPLDALGLLVAVWTALGLGGAAAPIVGRGPATLAAFLVATLLCAVDLATSGAARRATAPTGPPSRSAGRRRRRGRGGRGGGTDACAPPSTARRRRAATAMRSVGFGLAGFLIAPGAILLATTGGALVGLAPPSPTRGLGGPGVLVASLALAPCFEEHLYRGRLLPALAPRAGRAAALWITSVLFALPHLEAVPIIGASMAGLVLGVVRLETGRTFDCVALHAGMNLAAHRIAGTLPLDLPLGHPAFGVGAITAASIAWVRHARSERRQASAAPTRRLLPARRSAARSRR